MKRKFLSVMLFAAITFGAAGTFTSCKDYDDDIDGLQEQVTTNKDAAEKAIKDLDSKLATLKGDLEAKDKALEDALGNVKKDVEAAQKAADEAKEAAATAKKEAIEEAKKLIGEAVSKLETKISDEKKVLVEMIGKKVDQSVYDEQVKKFNDSIQEIEKNISAIDSKIIALGTRIDDLTENVNKYKKELEVLINSNKTNIQNNADSIDAVAENLNKAIVALNEKIAEQETVLKNYTDQAKQEVIEKINALKAVVEKNTEDILANAKAIETNSKSILANKGLIEALTKRVAANEGNISEMKQQIIDLQAEDVKLAAAIAENGKAIEAINAEIGKINAKIAEAEKAIAKLNKDLNVLKTAISELFSHRLTSIVLAPDSYINGVESMVFNAFDYNPWKEVKADNAGTNEIMLLADGITTARYYVSPSSVTKADIKDLKVIWNNKVTNHDAFTKALEQNDVPVVIESYDVKDGVLTVNFKKETSKAFENGNKDFSIIALQADVKLTEEEIEKGVSPVVTSDWVRLSERSVRPYIHFAEAKVAHDDVDEFGAGIDNLNADEHPHFFKYSQIFNGNNKQDYGKYIVKDVAYTDTLDLLEMVQVCLQGKEILEDYEAESMKFEFALPETYELQRGEEEATDQQHFAAFLDKECTKLVSRAHDNTSINNRDAIGRQPVIRVELHDVKNDKIMDVRYFKIRWYDPALYIPEIWDADTLANVTENFACNKDYEIMVGTKVMNELIYQVIRQNGMSKEEFHAKYNYLNEFTFATRKDAVDGNKANALGSMKLIKGGDGEAITYNIKWTYNSGMEMTEEEYKAGFKTITVWGRFVNNVGTKKNLVVFPMTLTLKIEKMKMTAGYLGSYWKDKQDLTAENHMKSFQVNPSMMKDEFLGTAKFKDAQLIANILDAYLDVENANKRFADETELTNAEKAEFVFDASRLEECGLKQFTVSADGKQLKLGNTVAAEIVFDEDMKYNNMKRAGWIRLFEDPRVTAAEHGVPSDAAISLLGKNLPITLATENCAGVQDEIDHFLVNIIRPLKLEAKAMENKLTDLLHDGSFVRVDSVLRISENFSGQFTPANIVWENGKEVTPGLVEWYNVQIAEWDLGSAITNLVKDGSSLIPSDDQWGFKLSDVKDKYVFTACNDWKNDVTKPETTVKEVVYIKFENKSGTHLQRDLRLLVPVKVATKWGMLEAKVELIVKTGIADVDPEK